MRVGASEVHPTRPTLQENAMQYIRNLIHDLRMAWNEFRYIRTHLRAGGNPDERSF